MYKKALQLIPLFCPWMIYFLLPILKIILYQNQESEFSSTSPVL